MLSTSEISLSFGSRKLFDNVSLKFTNGNCYGIIGANGAGKSTFMNILSGKQEPSAGEVIRSKKSTLSVLQQDHFQYQEETVINTVIMGNNELFSCMKEKDAIYAKEDFSDEDGARAGELEGLFAGLGGWEAETDAATLLKGLGIGDALLEKKIKELKDGDKLKVLLAQALFGDPDNLLLDEPTNHLDAKSIRWLEDYLLNYENTVIVISHDRHFLNKVCTHMVDIDYGKAQAYLGNYDFWEQSSKLARDLRSNSKKKSEDKAEELKDFIRRFSANASKSKQATARKKQLENLTLDELPVSTRKYPKIMFNQKREAGDILLEVTGLGKTINGRKVLDNVTFNLRKGDKCIFVGNDEIAITTFFQILMGEMEPDSGTLRWGPTTTQAYLPKNQEPYFKDCKLNLIDWLRQYSVDQSEIYIRSFLGRMLFTGEESLKPVNVLSGGEKVRCMFARMMLLDANCLIFDGPTNHLDLESIKSLNEGLVRFPGTVLFATHDQTFAQTLGGRLFQAKDGKIVDHQVSYKEFFGED